MRILPIFILMYTLAMIVTAADAAVYKWTDENGQTVYSQTPPPAGAKSAEVVKEPPRPSTDPNTATQKTQNDAASFNQRRDDKKTAEQDQKKMQEAEAQRKKYCDEIRQNLDVLTNKPIVRRTDESGESVVLTAEEREADVQDIRERLKKDCQ